ncbi:peptidoglycan-binding protein [Streptomyces lydicus]|uniref:peptidoglycan-binding protein n=1 Tax=Streptomyces lydicus TaxID=47763 RepID=UPI0010126420|nr:peptidoglycan-binding protein [Streptomyces lydicus]MCZ1006321.1 peptidoglycan-binding protein [Streptomyces lydicus]
MPRMPGATWRPVINVHKDGTKEHRGLVLHVQAGDNSPFGWFNRSDSQASSDFWVSKTGVIEQYVDTGVDYAWAQAGGNPYYASVETEGEPSEPLTAAQVEGVAEIYAWGHKTFGWPLVVIDSTTAHGLTWHGAGGAAWGGHTGCPGDLRKKQRADIMARATVLAGGKPAPAVPPFPGRQYFKTGVSSRFVTQLGEQLEKRGFGKHYRQGPGPKWGEADRLNVRDFQRSRAELRGDADGYPGPLTWRLLFS